MTWKRWRISIFASLVVIVFLISGIFRQVEARLYPAHFRWMEMQAGNVLIYYPEGYESHAEMLATTAESYLDSLDKWYGHRPEIARIVLNPEMDRSQAMALINPTRIEIPIAPALDKGLRPQSSLYLDRVTGHELTHVYQMDLREGVARYLSPIFGEAIAPAALAPDWLLEGQAIWTESAGGGGRLYSSYQNMQMRTQLAQKGWYWPITQLSSAGRVNPPLNRAYTGGAYLYASLTGEFRASQHIAEWMGHQAAWPGLTGLNFSRSYNGRTLGSQWNALEAAQRDRLRDQMRELYNAGYAVGTPLLENEHTSYLHPKWTLEGELIVAERSYNQPNRVVSLSPAPGYRKDVVAYTGASAHEGLTPFLGGVIVSEIRRGMLTPEENTSVLVLVTRDGRTKDLAAGGLNGWAPAFHAESMMLAYIAPVPEGGMALRMVELDVTGNAVGTIKQDFLTRLGHLSDPSWSADGKLLAFTADLGEGEAIYVFDLADYSLRRVQIENAAVTWDPAFSPDGTLWLSSDLAGIFNLYEVSLSDSSAMQRSRVVTGALEPSISSDGARVAYAHYTAEGFNVALLDSSRWLNESVAVDVETVSRDVFAQPDTLLTTGIIGSSQSYSPLPHMAPNYAMPSYANADEMSFGATVFGRDPVGLLSWNLTARMGVESIQPYVHSTITYRGLPVNLSLSAYSYPDELLEVVRAIDNTGDTLYYLDPQWERELNLGLTAFQTIHLDKGKWRATAVPYAGLVQRIRHRQTTFEGGLEANGYLGIRVGGTYTRYYSALRDPVPSRLESVRVIAERGLPGMDLEADLIEVNARKHIPGPFNNTVIAVQAAVQAQNGILDFSRVGVRPRGYTNDDLPDSLRSQGRIMHAGAEFHFPLLFPDGGWPGLGYVMLERISGSLFAEGSTGWGSGLSLTEWAEQHSVASVGGVLSFRGWLFFQAETKLDVGVAWRTEYEDAAVFVNLSFPELMAFVNDSPDW
jgi:WD40-like Beta Propeller Repeat